MNALESKQLAINVIKIKLCPHDLRNLLVWKYCIYANSDVCDVDVYDHNLECKGTIKIRKGLKEAEELNANKAILAFDGWIIAFVCL